ncbi:MAG TPA: hypothetical protein VM695_09610 [Phycisphaerae bacterium]|nr:hypothetical protein [Phycisphaerae bacterium]
MATILIGLDDTDNQTSRGTGHMARMLLAELAQRGCAAIGVSRHQLLLDPRIPYTSHNSSACVAVAAAGPGEAEAAFDFVAARAAEGSDPGVCVAAVDLVPPDVIAFARRATREIVEMDEAFALAEAAGLPLRALGGSGLGVIGALSAVGLRAEGNEGRVIALPGLREMPRRVRGEDFARLGIRLRHQGRQPNADDAYDTLDWVRPRLVAGQAVLPVEWSEEHDAWVPVDRKRSRPLE